MADQKKQHYVPKLYMKLFTNLEERVNVFIADTKKTISNAPYESHCYKDYYYGVDLVWENKLGAMESKWGVIFDKFNGESDFIPNYSEIDLIKKFALYQRHRALGNNEYLKEQTIQVTARCLKMQADYDNIPLSYEKIEEFARNKQNEEFDTTFNLEMSDKIINDRNIDDLGFLIMNYNTDKKLIVGDNPIILFNKFFIHGRGYRNMGLTIFFPITPRKLIVFYDAKMYPLYKNKKIVTSTDEQEVEFLNAFQYISAEKILLSDSPIAVDDLIKYKEHRNITNRHNKTGIIPSLIHVTTYKPSFFDCNLSFCELPQFVQDIPIQCREAAIRNYEKEWEEKFKQKETLLPALYETSEKKFDIGSDLESYKRGLKNMTAFAQKYWKS